MSFCPECGTVLHGEKICPMCTYNFETNKREVTEPPQEHNSVNIAWPQDTSPRFGMLDPMYMPDQPIDMFCPECGTPLIKNKTVCPNCKYKKEIKKEKKNSE